MCHLRISAENFYMRYKFTCKITVTLILVAALNWKQTVNSIIIKPITKTVIIIAIVTTTRMIIMVTLQADNLQDILFRGNVLTL